MKNYNAKPQQQQQQQKRASSGEDGSSNFLITETQRSRHAQPALPNLFNSSSNQVLTLTKQENTCLHNSFSQFQHPHVLVFQFSR